MSVVRAAWAVLAVGLALVVAADGSPWWRLVRVAVLAVVVLGAALVRRRRQAWIAEVVLGVAGAAVGGTIGIAFATRAGLSVKAAGGLLALFAGLGLVVHGGGCLLRATRRWYRLLAIPIALVAGYGLVLPLCSAVFATNVPRPEVGAATPADRGLSYVDARFRTDDGVTLSGWYVPSANGAAVVLLHGASSTRSAVLDQAVVLAHGGFGVLLFDARGHGRSSGRAMEFGWYGDRDVAAAVTYLQRRPDVDPARIGAVGMSMGGEEAIGAMAADRRIRAAVAEGATNRTFADKRWMADAYGVRGVLQLGVEWLTYSLADVLTAAQPPIALADAVRAAAPRPVLLIAAGDDATEQRAEQAIRDASPSTVRIWVVPGAGHIGGLHTARDEWARRVCTFLENALGARPGGR